jgi:hypothetical protein
MRVFHTQFCDSISYNNKQSFCVKIGYPGLIERQSNVMGASRSQYRNVLLSALAML